MPVLNRGWTSRKRRFSRLNRTSSFRFSISWKYLAFIAALLLLFGKFPLFFVRDGVSPAVGQLQESPWVSFLLKRALGENIPGLEPPELEEHELFHQAVANAFYSFTGMDPRDPRSILSRELGMGGIYALPEPFSPAGENHAGPPGNDFGSPSGTGNIPAGDRPALNPIQGNRYPVVLIYHSHITESFVPTSGVEFSDDLSVTVARLGDELASLLEREYGLPVVRDRRIYDIPREYAYNKARPYLEEIFAENPGIALALDIHRDGVRREVTTVHWEDRSLGKVMVIVGTRYDGWERNLQFALHLIRELEGLGPGLSRGARQHNFVYNQDLFPVSILLELGGHENSLEEALAAVPYLAEAVARTYYAFFMQS